MQPTRKTLRRCLRIASWTFLVLALGLGGGCLYAFRDRHPGYAVSLQVGPQPATETNQAVLRAGFSRVKINPDLSDSGTSIYLAGFKQNRKATSIHDDLWAVTCVIDDGRTRLGIVALDAIGFFHDEVIQVRARTAPALDLDYTVVCSTHNHNTPDLLGLWGPNYLKTGVNKAYRRQVIDAAAQSLALAVEALQPAKVAVHEIPTPPDGLVGDSRKPYVYDPDIRLMHFTHPTNGATLGTVIGWASHPETVSSRNTEITADYPGYLRDTLEKGVEQNGVLLESGLGGTHVFVNGAIGGLMSSGHRITVHDPYLQQDFKQPNHDKARALGRNLASRILRKLDETNAPALDRLPIKVQAKTVEIPLDNTGYLLAPVLGLIDRGHVRWKHIRTEVALLQLGDTSIACIPGEIYPELVNGGMERAPGGDFETDPVELPPIRDLMPGRVKFIFGLANDEIGYIIPKSEWDRKKPYLYGSTGPVYGEINSCGPEVAAVLHQAVRELSLAAGTFLFFDSFKGSMADGWSWIRSQPDAWRLTNRGLEIRVQPGNMWGPANDAKNVLLRQAPDPARGTVETTVQVQNQPTEQYEQVDLVWHYDDSHMVKIGQELVDGKLSIVMGREEKDRTRTLAIIPLDSHVVELRLRVEGSRIAGFFRTPGVHAWTKAGQCDLPSHAGPPHITLQCYQGPAHAERWALLQDFRLRQDPVE